jgi:hypothetical protein
MAEHVALKNAWGTLTGVWVPHDTRDQIVDFVRRWSEKAEITAGRFIGWLDVAASKFYDWRERYGWQEWGQQSSCLGCLDFLY